MTAHGRRPRRPFPLHTRLPWRGLQGSIALLLPVAATPDGAGDAAGGLPPALMGFGALGLVALMLGAWWCRGSRPRGHGPAHAPAPADPAAEVAAAAVDSRELRDELLGFLSHELRTPLAAVQSFAELMRITPHMSAQERREFLDIIELECQRLGRLSRDMLDFAMMQSGKVVWRDRPTDVTAVAGQVVRTLSVLAERHGVHLVLQHDPDLPRLHLDPDRLTQLLTNLVSNGLKFTPAGGQVHLRITAAEDAVALTVRDTGPGIAEEVLDRVFESYVKGPDQPRDLEGTGLGLALCERVVEHYGGTIRASNHPQGGALLEVALPCRAAAPAGA